MLKSEMRNENTTHIDKMSVRDMLIVMQRENENAVKAVGGALDKIERTIEKIEYRMKKGGRLIYVGCGTSGRLGVLDASEIPPTFGVEGRVIGIIAGGDTALRNATEGAEDNEQAGKADLERINLKEEDSVIGISAAGGAAYVIGALQYARQKNCFSGCITSNEDTKISQCADETIFTDTGAEVVTGSTRLKAGTAQKMVLNMISTALMIRLGYVHENLMINLKPTNRKLKQRMKNIVGELLKCSSDDAEQLLKSHDWNIKDILNNKR